MTGGETGVSANTLLLMQSPPMLQETCDIEAQTQSPTYAIRLLDVHLQACQDYSCWMLMVAVFCCVCCAHSSADRADMWRMFPSVLAAPTRSAQLFPVQDSVRQDMEQGANPIFAGEL